MGSGQRWRWHMVAAVLAALLCVGPAVVAAAAPQAPPGVEAGAGTDKFPMIVVFKDYATLTKLRVMCNTSPVIFRLFSRGLRLPSNCQMPGICRHIYSNTVFGVAGEFTNDELLRLDRCLPGTVFYREPDGKVFKAEDDLFWHPPGAEEAAQAAAELQRSRGARRLRTTVEDIPRVQSYEDSTRTPAAEGSAPIDLYSVTQGRDMTQPGVKDQKLTSRLWNLDRADQRELPLDGNYFYGTDRSPGAGRGATVYVVDSGIKLDHQEFRSADGSRVRAQYGYDFVENDYNADDCDGHGTHVSATAVGLQVGMAKDADVVAVRILDCTGSGTISDTVAGLDWVAANHKTPAIVTLSLGIQVGSWSRVLEDAVRSLILDHNITVVVASGNSGVDACYVAPANVPEVITVAGSNVATKYNGTKAGDPEDMYRWSNTGPCVDVFAPGVDIFSACGGSSRCEVVNSQSYTYASGTSMAVPHVAGVAAVYLAANPGALPRDVSAMITGAATRDKLLTGRFKPGTPNRLLYSRLDQAGLVQAANGP